jgi:thiol-disulfide isomerase/thioredoxin
MECVLMKATYFTASWCAPCRTFKPIASAYLNEAEIDFDYCDVDVDPSMAAAQQPPIMTLPTIVFYGGAGGEIGRVMGASEKMLKNTIKFLTDQGF